MTDEKISDDALAVLVLLSSSGKSLSEGEMSRRLGWGEDRLSVALDELEARGFAEPANSELN